MIKDISHMVGGEEPPEAGGSGPWLVLLRHKFCRMFRENLRAQHGQRGSIRAIATTIAQWTVAIELGMCRWGRSGGAAGSVTTGNGRLREHPGGTWCEGGIVSRSEIRKTRAAVARSALAAAAASSARVPRRQNAGSEAQRSWLRSRPPDRRECRKCRRQTGLTVGTVMERSHTPLSIWFWAAYLVASQPPGMSAVQFQRQLGLSRYAFQIVHKLRAGMVRPDQDRIGGRANEHVEVDETWVGGRTRGEGRGVHHKVLVACAVVRADRGRLVDSEAAATTMSATKRPVHPIAELFPMMTASIWF
jgi:hypothetical protein